MQTLIRKRFLLILWLFTMFLIVPHQLFTSVVHAAPACVGGVVGDDNSREATNLINGGAVTLAVTRLVVPSTPFNVTQVCMCWTRDAIATNVTFDLVVYQDVAGNPGAQLLTIPTLTATAIPNIFTDVPGYAFYDYPVNFTINDPSVFIGVRWNSSTYRDVGECIDTSTTSRTIITILGGAFTVRNDTSQMMIRMEGLGPAVVPPVGGGVLPPLIPNLGMIQINANQNQPIYNLPAGQPIVDGSNNSILLPQDFDSNGFDTYIITGVEERDDELWVSIFLGSNIWGWIPLADVLLIEARDPRLLDFLQAVSTGIDNIDPLAGTTIFQVEEPDGYAIVNIDNLNLRSGDSPAYTILSVLDGGTQLTVLGRNADSTWWFVETPDEIRGWVNDEYLILRGDLRAVPVVQVEGEQVSATILLFLNTFIYSTTNDLNVNRLCELPAGNEFLITAQTSDGAWYRIDATCNGNAVVGWISSSAGAFRNPSGIPVPIVNP